MDEKKEGRRRDEEGGGKEPISRYLKAVKEGRSDQVTEQINSECLLRTYLTLTKLRALLPLHNSETSLAPS